jgi:hypothetical protein
MRIGSLIGAVLGAVALGVFGTAATAGASTSTVVVHDLTFTEFFPDDICGPRASNVTFEIRTNVKHLTQHPDGSFSYQETSTLTYHVDFVDPTLTDQDSQSTESFHVTLTPGGTQIVSDQFHDYPTGIRITFHLHVTVVDGNTVVDREIFSVTGCP